MNTVANVVEFLESYAPPSLAAEWDNVGLLLGNRTAAVSRILTCLTITPEVVAEAVDWKAHLIVTHHPILFKPVQRLTDDTTEGGMLLELVRAGVAVYSPHTAFDDCAGGINDKLSEKLGLQEIRPLRPVSAPAKCKLAVFVPEQDLAAVSDAIFAAGGGIIGEYRECSFRLAGTGTFFGGDAANPAIGTRGRREEVAEWRLEVLCPQEQIGRIVSAMRKAHSYEEPAFDVYPLAPTDSRNGRGRIGRLPSPMSLRRFAAAVRDALQCGPIQMIGGAEMDVQVVAVACGAAGEFMREAFRAGAQVFVTGEMRFHDYLAARAAGKGLVLPGHYVTERHGVEWLAEKLGQLKEFEVRTSIGESDPVQWIV